MLLTANNADGKSLPFSDIQFKTQGIYIPQVGQVTIHQFMRSKVINHACQVESEAIYLTNMLSSVFCRVCPIGHNMQSVIVINTQ